MKEDVKKSKGKDVWWKRREEREMEGNGCLRVMGRERGDGGGRRVKGGDRFVY